MAKYLGETKSGSEGGVTYSRNTYGQYMRRHAIPVNPNTVKQRRVRGYFSSATQAWKTLSSTAQGLWASWAQLHPVTDRLGQSIVLKGNIAFVGQAVKALSVGREIPTTPYDDAVALDATAWVTSIENATGTEVNGVNASFTSSSSASSDELALASQENRIISLWASTPRQSSADFVSQDSMVKLGELVHTAGTAGVDNFSATFIDGDVDARLTGSSSQFTRFEIRDETLGLAKSVTLDAVVINTPFTAV